MNRTFLFIVLLISSRFSFAQPPVSTALPRPKLVVGIVVDQMRWDYLYRFYDRYTANGFKRMLREGFTCENTRIDYMPTVTAIGHSTIYTGSVPAIHGITGNDFIIQATGKKMYCAEDSTVETVGSTSSAGRMSPRNLLASTITDELKLATNFRAKVIGLSLKDRGSILPAGHAADAAYWFDDATGNFITSTYYRKELPAWLNAFNQKGWAQKLLKQDWNTLYALNTYVQSTADNNRYEGAFAGAAGPAFPVSTSGMFAKDYSVIKTTPQGNTLMLELAKAAIENERMGKGGFTDFLAVSFSATDYVGHKFGVNAIETEDVYLRLDKTLAELFSYLDQSVGKNAYTVFLTADHGAAHNPNFLVDNKIPAGFWSSGDVLKELNNVLEKKYQYKNIVSSLLNYQVHLNQPLITKNGLNEEAIRADIVHFLKSQPTISFVADLNALEKAPLPESIKSSMVNGYNFKRSGPIFFVLEPAWYSGSAMSTGTSHGTWYGYDAHIPLVWMGWGIRQGQTNRPTKMTDIAPTLAALLKIQAPNGSVGQPIEEGLLYKSK